MIIDRRPRPEIVKCVLKNNPEVLDKLTEVRESIPRYKREIAWYQACVLYSLASQYNYSGANFLEIGTAYGYSAATVALAAPKAKVTTLNPKGWEADRAMDYLKPFENVRVVKEKSWEFFKGYKEPNLDFIFIDGDHGKVAWDFGWWDRLKANGLMLFHDYAPEGSRRPCQPVFEAIEALRKGLNRPYDVLVTDTTEVGIAGFYRGKNEPLPNLNIRKLLWEYDPDDKWYKLNDE